MVKKEEDLNDRSNLDPDTLQDLQKCLYAWQIYNFGEQDNERVLLGICEESGELCHAQLKMEQGIRGDVACHEAALIDAIGDIMIYMLNYVSGMGEVFPSFIAKEGVDKIEDPAAIRGTVLSVYRTVGKLVEEPESMSRVQHITNALIHLCAIKGLDLEGVIRDTWGEVGQRDWKRFPKTGIDMAAAPVRPSISGRTGSRLSERLAAEADAAR